MPGRHMMTQTATYYTVSSVSAAGDTTRGAGVSFPCLIQADSRLVDSSDGKQLFSDTTLFTDFAVPAGATVVLPGESRQRNQLKRVVNNAPDGRQILEISV